MTATGPSDSTPARPPIPLSILIRTLNEADRIAETIEAAKALGGEIVVVDAGSKDDTVKIAEAAGARVIFHQWEGFGPQRYFGEDQCSHDMVFCLDADEITPPEFCDEVRRLFLNGDPPRLMIVKKAFVLPHWKRPPPAPFSTVQIYIYDRRIARTNPNPNWDKLDISEPSVRPYPIKAHVWHHSLRDWNHAVVKSVYVAQLAADTMKPKSNAEIFIRLVFEGPLTFFKFYVMRRYFLAGWDGFINAVISAYGRWLRMAMMFENKRHGPRQ
ncbi:MAG TPA: glycosyltransferase family 2 protein [Caulobacteraceae bacterium]|nr:glycosyltransferase family 2 protein [Caulobacteraceae bacterium]